MPRARRPSAVHEPDYKYIIQRLKQAREEADMTQVEVAEALERPRSFMSKCELGERRVDAADLFAFAELFGKPVEYFRPPGSARRVKHKKP